MLLDGTEEHYNIRRLDNRYRVTINRPGWNFRDGARSWYGYTSIYHLKSDHWEYVSGTSKSHASYESATSRAKQLWEEWRP
jgi:hypothetical protein